MKKKPKTELEYMEKGICPRCYSARHSDCLDGGMVCKRCGQRWTKKSGKIPSFDRRNNSPEEIKKEDIKMSPVYVVTMKKSRGRPAMPVGTIRTRKDGKVVKKAENGKWIVCEREFDERYTPPKEGSDE